MKASIELALRTREVYQLFERRIDGERLFIEAILHKFNIVKNHCQQQHPQAQLSYKQIKQTMIDLTQQFTDEIARFETLLAKKRYFADTKVCYVVKFRPAIMVTDPLAIQLIEFIEAYDMLIAILKLLHLSGCFQSSDVFFGNIKRYQKITNQMLSSLVLAPTTI